MSSAFGSRSLLALTRLIVESIGGRVLTDVLGMLALDGVCVSVGDELGLRRIIGHVSHQVLADIVHFAQSIIADRTGRASLAEQWLGSERQVS